MSGPQSPMSREHKSTHVDSIKLCKAHLYDLNTCSLNIESEWVNIEKYFQSCFWNGIIEEQCFNFKEVDLKQIYSKDPVFIIYILYIYIYKYIYI